MEVLVLISIITFDNLIKVYYNKVILSKKYDFIFIERRMNRG